jgi:hypothetical protein
MGILGRNALWMKFFVIMTPKGISLGETALFEHLRVKIGIPVRPADDLERWEKNHTQKLQLHQIGEAEHLGRSP